MARRRYTFLAAIIIFAAFALRLIDLTSIPPGLHFDEAANGIIVRGIAFNGDRPLFIASFTGKETLWFYLAALVMRIAGPGVFALRLTSVYIGTITVTLTGWLIRRLYTDSRRDVLALLAMSILAIAFWHNVLSRLAFRAISQPMMQALTLGLLWYALRTRKIAWLIAAGVATGLTAYTYLAVRLFPIPLALALIVYVIATRRQIARTTRDLAIYAISTLIAFAPLGYYFYTHPDAFSARITQVAPTESSGAWQGIRLALGMFFIKGDPLWRFNLPGKPLFGPLLAIAFIIGLSIVLSDAFTARRPLDRMRAALLIIWPIAMLMPTALAIGGITPSNLRAIGLIPLIVLYPALGILYIYNLVVGAQRWNIANATPVRWITPALVALFLIAGAFFTLRDLQRWGSSPVLYYEDDAHIVAVAHYLNDHPSDSAVYVATQHLNHPTLLFFADDSDAIRSLYTGDTLAMTTTGNSLTVFTRDALPPTDWLTTLSAYEVAAPLGPDGTPDFYAYDLPSDFDFGWDSAPHANFADLLIVRNASLRGGISGEEAIIDLDWWILRPADQPDYAIVAEVCDMWDWCWLRVTEDGELERGRNNAYSSTQWAADERMFTRLTIPLPPGMPPGEYIIRISVFSSAGNTRLPLLNRNGDFAGQFLDIYGLEVSRQSAPDPASLAIQYPQNVLATPAIELLGHDQPVSNARQGELIPLALHWRRMGTPFEGEGIVTIALNDEIILYQGLPVNGSYSMSDWQTGEIVTDRYQLYIPPELPPDSYTLTLRLDDGPLLGLGTLTVEATDRAFEFPENIQLLAEPPTFGGQITLIGHDEPSSLEPGQTLDLRLTWIDAVQPDHDYSLFIHVVDETGTTILTQYDGPPIKNGEPYPTGFWIPGEVVDGIYPIVIPADAPSGLYHIRVGLYLPENGQRLTMPGSSNNAFELPSWLQIGTP